MKLSELTCSDLNHCKLGLRHLSSMKNLEVLNLDSRDIGDEGCKYIRGLPLKTLDLFSSRVTDLGYVWLICFHYPCLAFTH